MADKQPKPFTPTQEKILSFVVKPMSRVVTVASKGGSAKHPLWYLNLRANPECEVEIGREKRRMRAHTANAQERAKYWPQLVKVYPDYAVYQRRTAREIPVVVLTAA